MDKGKVLIDTSALLKAMDLRGLGTGTFPPLIGASSDDILRVIATGEAESDLASKLANYLGDNVLVKQISSEEEESSDDLYVGTIAKLQERVRDGVIEPGVLAAMEREADSPRSTLIHWLEENYGV